MKTNIGKRLLSGLLSLIMVLSLVPAVNLVPEAEAAPSGDVPYISLPVTIRDFAADGMLFEFNQVSATGTANGGEVAATKVFEGGGNLSNYNFDKSSESGYARFTANANGAYLTYAVNNSGTKTNMRYCVIKYRTNGVAQSTPTLTMRTGGGSTYNDVNFPQDGYSQSGFKTVVIDTATADNMTANVAYVTLYPRLASGKYIDIAYVAFFGNLDDANTYKAGDGAGKLYHQYNTAGFSLLSTDAKDYINNLPKDESQTIAGTDLIENGGWGLTSDPTPVSKTLTSGATQQIYGAWIRTDLVTNTLDAEGKPVYTQATVDYLAKYMQQIMAVPEQNSDGSYNTHFVTGHKLSQLGGETLAAKIRKEVTGGLGTYAAAKAKFDGGKLRVYEDIETWYDAAYFLLHNTFRDSSKDAAAAGSDGYGMPITQYKNVHLVQKTENGKTYYVFNSAYDGAKYDYDNGEIYNTQTSNITIAQSGGKDTYVRGNKLPLNCWDPIGARGYGLSGDTYGDMVSESTSDWAYLYDKVNYGQTLEGHAQFVYYEDEDLFFVFTGDDDVYLYINGVRVLDVGAAHSISKVRVNLNDVAAKCNLKDGEAYDFDFFFMERHGTAANFGIETNIKIVDPAMTTTKTGYQNGASTGYNGFVDPNKPVAYSFELQNNGHVDIQNLSFKDTTIGVEFTKDAITLNSNSNINEMYLYRWNTDGSIAESYAAGSLTADILKAKLAAGLKIGEKIGIYGFKYQIPTDKWVNDAFSNTVYTSATATGANTSAQTLIGMAEWKVQKAALQTEPFHVYDWVTKDVSKNPDVVNNWTSPAEAGVTVTKNELVQPIKDKDITVPSNVTIALCSASGNETGVNINKNATLNSDGSITYKSTQPGIDTVYYKVKGMNYDSMVYRYDVYTYGTVNNVYVLDYGLAVELNGEDFGLMVNDTLTVSQNQKGTSATVTGIQDATSNYGTFTFDEEGDSLKYTPNAIMNDTDSVTAKVRLMETDATEFSKFTGVDMYETVKTAPANVVYYEENFPGITYVNGDGNNWAHYETVDEEGNSMAGTEQSADQDSNYGSDPNYEQDKEGEIVSGDSVGTVVDQVSFKLDTTNLNTLQSSAIDALNQYLGLGGSDSNGTVNELVVNKTAEVMYFEFTGTGFEIVSRTTDEQYAVLTVQVQRKNEDGSYTIVRQKPVITESKGGDLYQVPIISITDLDRADYRVVVKAAGSTAAVTRVLYIDGIRIYGPLDDGSALEYYNPEEYRAEIFEIKELIKDGKMIYAGLSDSDDDLQLVTGSTMIENTTAQSVLVEVEDVTKYMQLGPNNELYLDGNSVTNLIAFFLTPVQDYPENARTLEIGAHRKSDSSSEDNSVAYMDYSDDANDINDDEYAYEIGSGTEMYYTIDLSTMEKDSNGNYLVMISANGSELGGATLALTNLKVAGYEINMAQTAVMSAYTAGTLDQLPIVAEPVAAFAARRPVVVPEETEPEVTEPEVTEPLTNLTIHSAALKASKVVSGKVANMTVKTSVEGATIKVFDAEGNEVTADRCTSKVSGDTVTFTYIWKVFGSRGDELNFTVRAYDADGNMSLNEEIVTVTIK